ncbi:MAG: hypothetical protein ACREFY_01925 [Acetobacteraceae bacterium]
MQHRGIGVHDRIGAECAIEEDLHIVRIVQPFAEEGDRDSHLFVRLVVGGLGVGEGGRRGRFHVGTAEQHGKPSWLGVGDSRLHVRRGLRVVGGRIDGYHEDVARRAGPRAAAPGRVGRDEARRAEHRRTDMAHHRSPRDDQRVLAQQRRDRCAVQPRCRLSTAGEHLLLLQQLLHGVGGGDAGRLVEAEHVDTDLAVHRRPHHFQVGQKDDAVADASRATGFPDGRYSAASA